MVGYCFTSCSEGSLMPASSKKIFTLNDSIPFLLKGIQNGDLALRLGNDITSNMLAALNTKDKRFSHVGICVEEEHRKYIYHIIGGEGNNDDYILKTPLDSFFNAENNLSFGYASTSLSTKEKEVLFQIIKKWQQEKITFDMDFDLQTDNKMYCSEMVAKALDYAVNGLKVPSTDTLNEKYFAVDNITGLSLVKQIFYIKNIKQ
ncbi:MAG TPA: YiiX/YebB-like N1pC/P60 family cysteine hydrolase [Edaphocola sp.]|nr:YiiX/YebB-like N1pC/P60 family cysteine hydrolase [Edaphocola sp.]